MESLQSLLNMAMAEGRPLNYIEEEANRRGIDLNYTEAALFTLRLGRINTLAKVLRESKNSLFIIQVLGRITAYRGKGSRYIFEYFAREFPDYTESLIISLLPRYNESPELRNRINYLLNQPGLDLRYILTRAAMEDNGEAVRYILDRELPEEEFIAQLLFQVATQCNPNSLRIILDEYLPPPIILRDLIDYLKRRPKSEKCDKTLRVIKERLSENR